jgi:cytochrome c oxidase subunit 2
METQTTDGSRQKFSTILLTIALLIAPLVAAWLASRRWLPALGSEHGAGIDQMLYYLITTVGVVLIIGHLVLAWIVFRYSRGQGVTMRAATRKQEWGWAIVPVVIMMLVAEGGTIWLGLPVWKKVYGTTVTSDTVTVQILSEQFAWQVHYPGADGKFGKVEPKLWSGSNPLGLSEKDKDAQDDLHGGAVLRLPVGKPARILLRTKDVIHSLFIPAARIKQDAVPGMVIEVWFTPTQIGEFEIACTELCGLGHYKMRGILKVMSQEDYDKWLQEEEPYF